MNKMDLNRFKPQVVEPYDLTACGSKINLLREIALKAGIALVICLTMAFIALPIASLFLKAPRMQCFGP